MGITKLTPGTVGFLPLQRADQVDPRSRIRRRLLGPPVQAESVACVCGRRVRCGAGIRGVQLELEACGEGDQEAGVKQAVLARGVRKEASEMID
jgi:hypothetical protein